MKHIVFIGQKRNKFICYDKKEDKILLSNKEEKKTNQSLVVFFILVTVPLLKIFSPIYMMQSNIYMDIALYCIGTILIKSFVVYYVHVSKKKISYTENFIFSNSELTQIAITELDNCKKVIKIKTIFVCTALIASFLFFKTSMLVFLLASLGCNFCVFILFTEKTRERIRILKKLNWRRYNIQCWELLSKKQSQFAEK